MKSARPPKVAEAVIRWAQNRTLARYLKAMNTLRSAGITGSKTPAFLPLVLVLLAFSHAHAQTQTYRLTDIGVPAGRTVSHPAAINIQGWVAGSDDLQAFRYVNGVNQELGTLEGGTVSTAAAINSDGDVAGASTFQDGGNVRHATLFNINGAFDLGTLPIGDYSFATGLNDNEEVVGYASASLSSTQTRAFIWDPFNEMSDIGTLGGQYARALSINNSSAVTGAAQIGTFPGSFHAFIWDRTNGMRDLGTLAGSSSSGNFINERNHIVGSSSINSFDNREHAFLYDGTLHDLGSLGGDAPESDRSVAYGINIYDQVVGTTYRPSDGNALYQVAFVYREGQMFDLEKLVDASGADYRLLSAVAINDYGIIAVDAIKVSTNEVRTVVLTPNPSGHDFVNVADSNNPSYNAFGSGPSINDNGTVTFYAELNGAPSIYKAERNATPFAVSDSGTGAPAINNLGEVASRRFTSGAQVELYKTTDGTAFQQIAITGTQFRSFPGFVALANNTGMAVFYAPLNPVSPTRRGIFTGNGNGSTSLVADNAGAFNDFGSNPTVNDAGTVAFSASLDTPVGGIYIGSVGGNGATTTVVTNETAALYNFDGSPFINNNGEITFRANEQATFAPAVWVVNQDGSNLRRIANVSGPFSQLQSPVINDVGTIVFFANLDNGGRGIFTGPNAGIDKVIAEGDPLFGSPVQSLGFFRGLNNQDEIAFSYTLADGRKGIARARVVPTADRLAIVPRITSLQKVNGKFRVSFASLSGQHYRVQRKPQIKTSFWDTVAGAFYIEGTGGVVTIEDPDSAALTSVYYRVVLLP